MPFGMNIQVLPPGTTLWFPAGRERGVGRHLVYTITGFEVAEEPWYTLDDTDVVVNMKWIQESGLELVLPQQQQQASQASA